jgi:hypothetical protein
MLKYGAVAVLVAALAVASCETVPSDTYSRDGWPEDSNTGPEVLEVNEDELPDCSTVYTQNIDSGGTWVIDQAETVIEQCRHVGAVDVTAADVTLSGVEFIAATPGSVVEGKTGSSGLVIDASIVRATNTQGSYTNPAQGQKCSASVDGIDYTLTRSEVFGCADGIKVTGTVLVQDSFLHSFPYTCSPTDSTSCTHNDAVQYVEGTGPLNLTFLHNGVYGLSCVANKHFQIEDADGGATTVEDSFFYGLNGIANIRKSDGATFNFDDNVVAGGKFSGPFLPGPTGKVGLFVFPTSGTDANVGSTITITDQTLESAETMPSNFTLGTTSQPYTCGAMPPPTTTTSTTSTSTTTTTVGP